MEIFELKAEARQETGKSKAKQMRARGVLPANLYGYQTETRAVAVNGKEFMHLISTHAGSNVLMKLQLDGDKAPTVMVKEIQRDPIRDIVLHVDFLSVSMDKKIVTAVPISLVGESLGVREGGIVQHGLWEVQVEAIPTNLPDHVEVDITELSIGDSLHVKDIVVPKDLSMVTNEDEVVVTILPPVVFKEEVEEVEEEVLEEGLEEGEEVEEEAEEEKGEVPSEASEES